MKCKTCGTEFEGKFCSKCGAPAESSEQQPHLIQTPVKSKKPFYKLWWLWVIIAIVFIVIIGNIGGNKGKTDDGSSAVPNTTASQTDKNTFQTESAKDNLSNVAKEYTLTAGYYTAGIDFPAGKCNVTALSGTGNLSSSNMYSGGINAMFGIDDGTGLYTGSFNGLKLPSKTTLLLNGVLKIKLEYTSVDSNFTGRIYDENAAITLKDGNYEADIDFTAGTYKVMAVSGRGNLSSSNMYNGGMNEIFGVDDGTGMYNNQFLNANLEKGVTLNISGGLTIKLIPAK